MTGSDPNIAIPLPTARARWAALGLIAGLIVAVIAGPSLVPRSIVAANPDPAPEHTISVSGTGRVMLSPDIADLRLGVSITAKTVKEARASNAAAMTAVIASLKKLGIADKDIQTTILSLQPVYDYSINSSSPRLTGYNLSNAVAVTVRNLDKVGDAIDGALAAGATTMDGLTFRVADQAAAERQAREAAMAEAKAKAQALASAAGVAIKGVASISETVTPVPYPMIYGGTQAAPAKDAATPVQPGTNEVSVVVAVAYVIG